MDLISTLAKTVGISDQQAQAVAGLALGATRSQVAEKDPGLAGQLAGAIPELAGWQQAAAAVGAAPAAAPAGGGLLGGLMSAASGGVGNQLLGAVAGQEAAQGAQLVGLLGKLGLGAEHAALAAPVLLQFLKSRLGDDTVGKVLAFAPMLSGGAPAAGGVAGMLGGLLK